MTPRRQRGPGPAAPAFSLLELLAVIGILAVLVGVTLPVLGRMRWAGQKAATTHNLRQLATATFAYCGDNNGLFPLEREDRADGRVWWYGFEPWSSWSKPPGERWVEPEQGPLAPYLGTFTTDGRCPLLVQSTSFRPKYSNFRHAGYGYNEVLGPAPPTQIRRAPPELRKRLPTLDRPAEVALFATTAQIYPFGSTEGRRQIEEFPFFNEQETSVHFRFGGKALVAFADGRVSEVAMDPATLDPRAPQEKIARFAPVSSFRYLK